MFEALGRVAVDRRRWVLGAAVVLVVLGAFWGTGVFANFTGGAGFDDPASSSSQADAELAATVGRQASDVVVLYDSPTATVDQPAFRATIDRVVASVPPGAARVSSFWTSGNADLVSSDRHATAVTVSLPSDDEQGRVTEFRAIAPLFAAPGYDVRFGGLTAMTQQVNALTSHDIGLAESTSIPVLLVLLVLLFGSLVAASLPLAIGALVALGSFVVLRALTSVLDISSFAINVITILGLGLAIDYGLFMVNRYRDELAAGAEPAEAVRRTTASAGRAVAFSGATVAVSLACLTLFPARFLSSMGWAGISVVVFAVLSSVTVLPALMSLVGHRIDRGRIPLPARWRARTGPASLDDERRGSWYRLARRVMRRPLLATIVVPVLLLLLGAPILGANWARPGDWVLPDSADARVVTTTLADRFPADPAKLITVAVRDETPAGPAAPALDDYLARLRAVPGVTSAAVTGSAGGVERVQLGYRMDPQSAPALRMVQDVRAVPAPPGGSALVTGMPASRADIIDMISARLPWMLAFVALATFVLMFVAFGSVVIPIKSILLSALSLCASFGAIDVVFGDGFLSGLLGFTPIGAVDIDFPVLIIAIAFGLAMDYEVFLLSRIREEWERSRDVEESVALGMQRTGWIISAAALLLVVVVGGFVLAQITFLKMVGVGLVIAVVVDVAVVRALLVPATMRLLGERAWWAPAPMARWWRAHLAGAVEGPAPAVTTAERETVQTAGH